MLSRRFSLLSVVLSPPGRAALNPDGSLDGYLYFHLGDESAFGAVPFDEAPQ
jgi:hypothetical protein